MLDYFIEVKSVAILNDTMSLVVEGYVFGCPEYTKPKLILYFQNESEGRYIPMVIQEVDHSKGYCKIAGVYSYRLDKIYWDTQSKDVTSTVTLDLLVSNDLETDINYYVSEDNINCQSSRFSGRVTPGRKLEIHQGKAVSTGGRSKKIKKVISSLLGSNSKEKDDFYADKKGKQANVSWNNNPFIKLRGGIKRAYIMAVYELYKKKPVKANQVLFLSQRSNELTDNELFINDALIKDESIEVKYNLSTITYGHASFIRLFKFAKLCAYSKVIIVDEYVPPLYFLHTRKETYIIQVWHACGAFKTVGFSRLGKQDAPIQSRRAHRNYDYSIVSSSEICRWYAEAFGLSPEKVVPLGVPRTDIFFSEEYAENIKEKIYSKYPAIKGKKVILFAPTFRGGIKNHANYPIELFDVGKISRELGDDYVILVKHHPFVEAKHPIPDECADRVIDVWDYPSVNDLLFVTDILISDYSSVIFEASLLDIPMLFYGFDLDEYIAARDFYYEFRDFVPGKIVVNQDEIIQSIKDQDFHQEKVETFKNRFFEYTDGKSTERVCQLIKSLLNEI